METLAYTKKHTTESKAERVYQFRSISIEELAKIHYHSNFPSCRAQWMSNWLSVFKEVKNNVIGYGKKPYIIAAFQKEELVAIVPLLKLNRTYFKYIRIEFLEFLGQQWSSLGNDIIVLKELEVAFTSELIRWIKKNIPFHFLFLKYLPENSIFAKQLSLFHYAGAAFIEVDSYNNYEDFAEKVYTRKFREDLRRTLRRTNKHGFEMTVNTEKITKESLKQIRRISKSKLIDGKSFLYEDAKKEEFHLKMYEEFNSQVVFVKFNGQPVAYGTSIDWNGERIGIDAAFDRDYRKFGAGIQCINASIKTSFEDKMQKMSFGMGLDTYKFQFTDKVQTYYMSFDFTYRLKALLALPYFYYQLQKRDKKVSEMLRNIIKNE
ncbi:GNAT family N-acetyltransferase [Ancylomarina longa]|uniref:GNAT family N-acetyltransferase n=1 Tax=Ancylomarina longa TaxID=2487017 RepID=A0A434ATX1_9BACT|nr:GNAT family N-acetyltransferase [Ancylomarina longa]RUT77876.1 GNAT family N-acetyltransferase [Ancylomarina longa]